MNARIAMRMCSAARLSVLLFAASSAGGCGTSSVWTSTFGVGAPPPAQMTLGPDGQCPAPASAERPAPRGPIVGASECDVVRSLGPTERMEVGTNERGERTLVLTYAQGTHAGVYRFAGGALVSIEALPAPAVAEKPKRTPAKPKPKRPPAQSGAKPPA